MEQTVVILDCFDPKTSFSEDLVSCQLHNLFGSQVCRDLMLLTLWRAITTNR